MTKEVTYYPGGGVGVVEYEWGVMTFPPLIFAYRFHPFPDMESATHAANNDNYVGFFHLVRRPVGQWEVVHATR